MGGREKPKKKEKDKEKENRGDPMFDNGGFKGESSAKPAPDPALNKPRYFPLLSSSPYLPLLSSPPLFLTLFTYRVDASPRGGPNFNMSLGSQVAKLVLAEAEQSEKALEQIFGDLLVWEERGDKR